ncbi:MAG: hypothetical protein IKI37_06525 [Oscillospiraceae bacterium]|nr:hypothetical protein [Oscillospiraceae bacterium]MBR7084813.1 hypothetical protein [Oscillospiraceae bacterium]
MGLSVGMWILIGGGLGTLLGLLMLLNHGKISTIIIGILLLVCGLSAAKIGYDLDQSAEVEYTVVEITPVTERDSNNNYRVTIKDNSGVETWIYVNEDNIFRFPKDEKITMTKHQVKEYSNTQNAS